MSDKTLQKCAEGLLHAMHPNVRENGELVRPDCATDILASIHSKGGREEIMGEFNLHSLRNTYASKAREGQMRDHMIAAVVGHKDVDTTQGYMSVTSEEFYGVTKAIRGLAPVPSKAPENLYEAEIYEYFRKLDAAQRKTFMLNLMDIQYESA